MGTFGDMPVWTVVVDLLYRRNGVGCDRLNQWRGEIFWRWGTLPADHFNRLLTAFENLILVCETFCDDFESKGFLLRGSFNLLVIDSQN